MKAERTLSAAQPMFWAVCICILSVSATHAQNTVQASFAPVVNGPVSSAAAQADGKVVIGGMFTQINGVARPYLARLNADGSLDSTFNPVAGPGQFINRVEISGSKIFASGGDGIRRFSDNGALDWHYPMQVATFAVDPQQRVVFGGRFVRVDNQYHRNLARLTSSGSLDGTFAPVIGCCAGDGIDSILVTGDTLLVGGAFQSVNEQNIAGNLARLQADGSLVGSFTAAGPSVLDIALAPDGKVYSVSEQTLERHLPSGTVDPAFAAPAPAGFDERFLTVAAHGNGVLVGGNFTFNTGGTRTHLARFTADGSLDASFSAQPNGPVRDIAVQADGSVIIVGDFTQVDGQSHAGVARIVSSGGSAVAPSLTTARSTGGIVVSWPASAVNGRLEFRELNGNTWTPVGIVPATINGRCCVTNTASGPGRIYRLVQP
jgi:uncharacterized delta-60 repeat protein